MQHWHIIVGVPLLPRYTQDHLAEERKLARILLESGAVAPVANPGCRTPAGGDPEQLRGVPVVGSGWTGATDGSDPWRALSRKESRRR
jgi:hypothetical protein